MKENSQYYEHTHVSIVEFTITHGPFTLISLNILILATLLLSASSLEKHRKKCISLALLFNMAAVFLIVLEKNFFCASDRYFYT